MAELYTKTSSGVERINVSVPKIEERVTNLENNKLGKTEKAASALVADSATKATQDDNGNVINTTYATKTEVTSGLAGKAPTSHTHTISNIADLQTQLDDLAVDTWKDNQGNWYRVWSDGWIEQGGIVYETGSYTIISFHKPFVRLPFRAVYSLGQQKGVYPPIYNWTCVTDSFTNSTMSIFVKDGGNYIRTGPGFWYACGY